MQTGSPAPTGLEGNRKEMKVKLITAAQRSVKLHSLTCETLSGKCGADRHTPLSTQHMTALSQAMTHYHGNSKRSADILGCK